MQPAEFVDLVLVLTPYLDLIFADGCFVLFRKLGDLQLQVSFPRTLGNLHTMRRCIMTLKCKLGKIVFHNVHRNGVSGLSS